ncbi:MAG: phytanoyl-CoA dioxygenase family protein [Polyangiaceae bacterium]|jgi:hypothetical protein|nr:phytanoyl-CoA dioxygenase family protein [Polyangiaceae bacterium]
MELRRHPLPDGPLRDALYQGEVFLLAPTRASLLLTREVLALLEDRLGPDPRAVHQHLSNEQIFARVGELRRLFFLDPHFHQRTRELIDAVGLDPGRCAFDPMRLRVVLHDGHKNPLARAVYYPHRDTWYAHPPSVIAFWIPLHDLLPDETFVFYPERLRSEIPNDSERFDYPTWVKKDWGLKIGWQGERDGERAHYPGTLGAPDPGPAVGFSCQRGETLLFAGAHYHQTLAQSTGRTRFSLDFRVVHLGDLEAGRGAPSVDRRCTGSAVVDYVHPAGLHG